MIMDKDISEMVNKFLNSSNSSNTNGSSNSSDEAFKNRNSQDSFNNSSNFDMYNLLKLKSIMDKLNSSNDPRNNLLKSLKPYLQDEKKSKVDQYINFLNMAKIVEILKQERW